MASHSFNRPPRVRPRWAGETVALPEPPAPLPRRNGPAWATLLLPLLGALLLAGFGALGGGSWLIAIPGGILALLGVGAALLNERGEARRARAEHAERKAFFEDQLEAQRSRLRRLYAHERSARLHLSPDPAELLRIAGAAGDPPEPRLWERRRDDDDFLELRVGCGSLPAAAQAQVPPPPRDAPADRRLYQIAEEYATLQQVPICLPLARLGSLGVAGPRAAALPTLHALLWQAAVLHAPSDLRIAAIGTGDEWEWLRWLPHSVPLSNDADHSQRMCAATPAAAAGLVSGLLDELGRRRERRAQAEVGAPPAHEPQLLLVIDGVEQARAHPALGELISQGAELGLAVIVLAPAWALVPEQCAAVVEVFERGARWTRAGEPWPRERISPDRVDPLESDRLARRLAGLRIAEGGGQDLPRNVRLFDLLQIAEAGDLEPPRLWEAPLEGAWRPVPIGALAEGKPILLDLNESRHGPHGIIAGATGAGKSVLLQGIIAALTIAHSPERLQLLLIDFKGGASLAMFAGLAHSAGLVTDLEGRMAERAITAIKAELRRRKALLRQTAADLGGKVENIADYRGLAAAHGLAPLPNLLLVVDEFDELARSYPEFVGELVRVVKQGRSLGVHLLLATQQPARAVTDEIRSQLKFFIALRLGGAEDSREMLLKPDAAFLPTDAPGRAYMRVGGEVRLLQVAHVAGRYRPRAAAAGPRVSFLSSMQRAEGKRQKIGRGSALPGLEAARQHAKGDMQHAGQGGALDDGRLTADDLAGQGSPTARAIHPPPPASDELRSTDLDVLTEALAAAGRSRLAALGWEPAPIWRAPLPGRLSLGDVVLTSRGGASLPPGSTMDHVHLPNGRLAHHVAGEPPLSRARERGTGGEGEIAPPDPPWLRPTLGLLDIPQESRQEPFGPELAGAHLAVVGAPGSGKTNLLRTLVLSLALAHPPRDLWCYMIDAGGHGLAPLAGLPQVGALIQAREHERVRRLIRMLDAAIRDRQERFRAAGAGDLPGYRAATGEPLPALLLVIDKVAVLREELRQGHDDMAIVEDLLRLARVGRPFGVHLVISADRAADLSYKLLALLEQRIALRMPDAHDYGDLLGARVSAPIPAGLPGRALWAHPDHGPLDLQVALPSADPSDPEAAGGPQAQLDADLVGSLRGAVAAIAQKWGQAPEATSQRPAPVELLPERVLLGELPLHDQRRKTKDRPSPQLASGHSPLVQADIDLASAGLAIPFGREGQGMGSATLHLSDDSPHALIVGPRRSGKTTALITLARSLAREHDPEELIFLILDSPRGGLRGLRDLPHTRRYTQSAAELADELADLEREQGHKAQDDTRRQAADISLAQQATSRHQPGLVVGPLSLVHGVRALILIDDYTLCRDRAREQLSAGYGGERTLLDRLCAIAQLGGPPRTHLLAAAGISYADDNLLRALDGSRSGIILWPDRYEGGTRLLGVALPRADQRGADQPPGRALLVGDDEQLVVQVALVARHTESA